MTIKPNKFIQKIPIGKYDIVGDVHGEYQQLVLLMSELGYDSKGNHPEQRRLIFIGDLCDRGLNSPAVFNLVIDLVLAGKAYAILGNHEINLLANDARDGSGWFFENQYAKDKLKYQYFNTVSPEEKVKILAFIKQLPIALVAEDLRVVHACWDEQSLKLLEAEQQFDSVLALYQYYNQQMRLNLPKFDWYAQYLEDRIFYQQHRADKHFDMPLLHGLQQYDLYSNRCNPIRLLTSGYEIKTDIPFFISGRWRFTTRAKWWNEYRAKIEVVFGHYWRLLEEPSELFSENFLAWLGEEHNSFCVDYSAGAMWKDRQPSSVKPHHSKYHLAALRWPEKMLMTSTGACYQTK